MEKPIKSGVYTTEFWLTLITAVIVNLMALLMVYGLVTVEQSSVWQTFILSAVALFLPFLSVSMNKEYTLGRTALKQEVLSQQAQGSITIEPPFNGLNWGSPQEVLDPETT